MYVDGSFRIKIIHNFSYLRAANVLKSRTKKFVFSATLQRGFEESFEYEPKVVHQINREHLVRTNSERVLTHTHTHSHIIAFSVL